MIYVKIYAQKYFNWMIKSEYEHKSDDRATSGIDFFLDFVDLDGISMRADCHEIRFPVEFWLKLSASVGVG